jgi:asparagine synthase (glutamine-hydrolysing)
MCGILGGYSLNSDEFIDEKKIKSGLELMHHRGPNYKNCIGYDQNSVVLGHARLSIIDLSDNGNQPMEIGDYKAVFNGEIYNYIEIRAELIQKGYKFFSDSDTEVLINAYDYWGEECVSRFNGMWSFVILTVNTRKLFCSRDRFGVKPFNYYLDTNKFIFGSEIKAILAYDEAFKKPNYNAIGLFGREGICGEIEETWFDNIKRLMPGHNLVIEKGTVSIHKYYSYPTKIQKISFDEAKNKFKEIFTDAVSLRMRSDVPLGTTLSGGLDSSSIVSSLRTFYNGEHDTFTAHFPNFKDDEYLNAHKTNEFLSLNENSIVIDYDNNYLEILNKIVYHLESGHLSPSVFPLWKVYEKCSEKVTVVLEGQGADELMGGYISSSSGPFLYENLKRLNFRNFFKQAKLIHANYGLKQTLILFARIYSPNVVRELFRKYVLKYEDVFDGNLKKYKYPKYPQSRSESFFINSLQDAHRTTLVNLLHYGDALSMAFSLESRLPFMDYRLVDFCFSLPSEYLINDGKGKFILRETMKDILPPHIYQDHKKLGFPSPIDLFFKENKNLIKDILLNDKAKSRNLFNTAKLESLIDTVGEKNNSERIIFRLICIELWFRNFID